MRQLPPAVATCIRQLPPTVATCIRQLPPTVTTCIRQLPPTVSITYNVCLSHLGTVFTQRDQTRVSRHSILLVLSEIIQ